CAGGGLTRGRGSGGYGEAERAADGGGVAALDAAGLAEGGHTLGQDAERDRGFQAGQRLAEAVVDAAGEGQVGGRALAGDVENGRTVVDLGVAVSRGEQGEDQLALADLVAGQLDGLERRSAGELDR